MKGRNISARIAAGVGAVVVCLGLAVTAATVTTAKAATTPTGPSLAFHGDAYGSRVKVGGQVVSGPSFRTVTSCGATVGQKWSNSGASADLPGTLRAHTIANQIQATTTKTGQTTVSSSKIQNVNLLKGMISAAGVDAVSEVTLTSGGQFAFKDGSSFGHILVGGKSQSLTPNKKVPIPGLGYAVFDQQRRVTSGQSALQTINMIHIYVTVANNTFNLDKGSSIIVGHATSAISRTPNGIVRGISFSSRVSVAGKSLQAGSGSSAPAYMPCAEGSDTNEIDSTTTPQAGTTGTGVNYVAWKYTKASSTASASSVVHSVDLLGGMIKATALHAKIHGVQTGSTYTFVDKSTISKLIVNGKPETANTSKSIAIPNVGTLYIHHVIKGAKSETVRMLDLVVSQKNKAGLPVGTHVEIGVSKITFEY